MGSFCSREREHFDESLNDELNEIAKAKPGESGDIATQDVNFDELMALKEPAHSGGGCCGGGKAPPKSLGTTSMSSNEEDEDMKRKREHFEEWCKTKVVGIEKFDESSGEKLYDQDFMSFLFAGAIFWMTVRTDRYKKHSREARRGALFGTTTPGGPKNDAPDPSPQSIEAYRNIIQMTTQKDMELVDDTLSAMLQIGKFDVLLFQKCWMKMSDSEEAAMKQVNCYKNYDAIITPTLTEKQQKECNKLATPLTEQEAQELFAIKSKVQLEQAQDIQDTMEMAKSLPEEQQPILMQQLQVARQLAVPMLADYIWWISEGKYEWTYYSNRLDEFIAKKQEEKDADWLAKIKEFEDKLKTIQGISAAE